MSEQIITCTNDATLECRWTNDGEAVLGINSGLGNRGIAYLSPTAQSDLRKWLAENPRESIDAADNRCWDFMVRSWENLITLVEEKPEINNAHSGWRWNAIARLFNEAKSELARWNAAHEKEDDEPLVDYKTKCEAVQTERDALQRFKDYVHGRLDTFGVPIDPDSIHKAEGCRIGGRLDWLFREHNHKTETINQLRSELEQVNAFARTLGYGQGELDSGLAECLQRSFDAMKAAASAEAQHANELQAELAALRTRAADCEAIRTAAERVLAIWRTKEACHALRALDKAMSDTPVAVNPPAPSSGTMSEQKRPPKPVPPEVVSLREDQFPKPSNYDPLPVGSGTITEGATVKGGTNPPNDSATRPAPPMGSGSHRVQASRETVDLPAITQWLRDPEKKPPELAFTNGATRTFADLLMLLPADLFCVPETESSETVEAMLKEIATSVGTISTINALKLAISALEVCEQEEPQVLGETDIGTHRWPFVTEVIAVLKAAIAAEKARGM